MSKLNVFSDTLSELLASGHKALVFSQFVDHQKASDCAHRLGQQRPVTIVRMVTTGTIEEQIQTLHGTKRELADSVLSGADSPTLDVETMIRLLRG